MPQRLIPSTNGMSSASAQLANRSMGIYDSNHQNSIWGNSYKIDSSPNAGISTVAEAKLDNGVIVYSHQDIHSETRGSSKGSEREEKKLSDKVLRRLAQNREAARKSRLRKKAYVQQLESGRVKLAQIEQEIERARQQGVRIGGQSGDSSFNLSGAINSGIAVFEMEYGHWVEIHITQMSELRSALQAHVSDIELRMLVEGGMNHYDDLFRIKGIAAKNDVFYLMSGMWKTAAERFFLWIGGFRPSELLKILSPELEPLTEQQRISVHNLQQLSQQAEDALSQGMDKLQQTLSQTLVASDTLGVSGAVNYMGQISDAIGKLEELVTFVTQADHLRQQTLQQMYKILTTRQAARALLSLGDYCQRLRALSSLWAARPREPT